MTESNSHSQGTVFPATDGGDGLESNAFPFPRAEFLTTRIPVGSPIKHCSRRPYETAKRMRLDNGQPIPVFHSPSTLSDSVPTPTASTYSRKFAITILHIHVGHAWQRRDRLDRSCSPGHTVTSERFWWAYTLYMMATGAIFKQFQDQEQAF